jgi:N6-adenosine-specific RNA methylase IME4
MADTQNAALYARVRRAARALCKPGTRVLSFGWNSAGMGDGFEREEILLVAHGGAHNDTICVAERLYLWTVNRYVEDAYAIARRWGFRPAQLLTWAKTPMGKGNGGAFSQTTEHVIFGRRGTLASLQRHPSTWWNWPRPRKAGDCHSRKPEAFLDLVEQVSPPSYLEMFARDNRLGWDSWGNECLSVAIPSDITGIIG